MTLVLCLTLLLSAVPAAVSADSATGFPDVPEGAWYTQYLGRIMEVQTMMGVNNINQAVGGVLQSTAQNLSTIKASDATRQESETKREEEMLDQTRDLFSQ